jgi:hypothetical protein
VFSASLVFSVSNGALLSGILGPHHREGLLLMLHYVYQVASYILRVTGACVRVHHPH